jgi:hypothetical protein
MDWITDSQIADAHRYGYRFDIGMPQEARNALHVLVKRGKAVKVKALWPYFTWGTRPKTCYVYTTHMA